ncbi:MAG: alpha-mannosidase, partial [Armatimonadota bacterium]|nr:alpha-mannosidase [Armatimonadota bacterium]
MLKHPDLTERRVDLFIRHTLAPNLYCDSRPLQLEFGGENCETQREAISAKFQPVSPGFEWGPAWGVAWFKAYGRVPKTWQGRCMVARLEVGGERTIWHENSPIFGVDDFHRHYELPRPCKPGDTIEIWVQAYGANPPVSVHGIAPELPEKPFKVASASLDIFDTDLWHLYIDCKFNLDLLRTLPAGDPARMHLLTGLNEAINVYDENRPETIAEARRIIKDWCESKRTDDYHWMTPVGHAHLDSAWLWPVSMTKHKMAHTTATQLALMDEYPEHVFVHSQASQYEWLECHHKQLFDAVKQKIRKGQWEPLGSMWVEADTNLVGGEALIRQFLYGKRYFSENFGVETKDMWLPDVFGYSAATPQILAKCNIDYFLTQKISWNQINKFPHNTFWWQGIDGTRVWTHFPPSDTYTGLCAAKEFAAHLQTHRDAARSDRGLYVFGYGDGGGGPTAEHLEILRRAAKAPNMPRIARQKAIDFFVEAKDSSRDLPVWVGELYAEFHRGTYTTQANTKKGNRECEMLLRDAEYLCSAAYGGSKEYPAKELERLWKIVLFNQFHDILPGSSVNEVYVVAQREYDEVRATAQQIIDAAISKLTARSDTSKMARPVA